MDLRNDRSRLSSDDVPARRNSDWSTAEPAAHNPAERVGPDSDIPAADPRNHAAIGNLDIGSVPNDGNSQTAAEDPPCEIPPDRTENLAGPSKEVVQHERPERHGGAAVEVSNSRVPAENADDSPATTGQTENSTPDDAAHLPAGGTRNNVPDGEEQLPGGKPADPTDPNSPDDHDQRPTTRQTRPLTRTHSAPAGPSNSDRTFPFPPKLTPLSPPPLPHPSPPAAGPSLLQRFRNSSLFDSEYVGRLKRNIRLELREMVGYGVPIAHHHQIKVRDNILGMMSRAEWAGIPASWIATHLGKAAQRRKSNDVSKVQIMADVKFWEEMWDDARNRRARVLAGELEEVKAEGTGTGGPISEAETGGETTASTTPAEPARARTSEEEAVAAVAAFEDGSALEANSGVPGATGFPTAAEQIARANARRRQRERDGFLRRLFGVRKPEREA